MRGGVSLQTRREFLQHMLPRYRRASSVKKKSKLLDAFTAAFSTMHKRGNPYLSAPILGNTDQTCSTRCS